MAEKIIIQLELDDKLVEGQLKKTTASVSRESKKIGEEIEKGISEDSIKKITDSFNKIKESEQSVIKTTADLGKAFEAVGGAVTGITALGIAFKPLVGNLKDVADVGKDVAGILFKPKGLFGLVSSLGTAAASLRLFAIALDDFDNSLAKTFVTISNIGAILIGGFAAAIGVAIVAVSDLAFNTGSRLVEFFDRTAISANKAEQSIDVFSQVISNFNQLTNGAVGSTETWQNAIASLSGELNISQVELRKAAQEIVQVGSQLGFTEEQLLKLTRVSAEYAKINGKDVFQTSVAVVSALQGSTQAIQNYGVKLNETAIQQFAYKKGLDANIRSLSEQEVVQLRYNKLLDSFSNVAGVAQVASNSLADQQNRLQVNTERLSQAFGRGARLIEQNNLVAGALNVVLGSVNDNVIATAGFFGALGARLLQIIGFLTKTGFQIFGVVKAIQILNAVLSSNVGINAFATKLPFINQSLNQLISNITRTEVRITSLNTLLRALGTAGQQSIVILTQRLLGLNGVALTTSTILGGISTRLIQGFRLLIPIVVNLGAVLLPIAAIIGTIVGVFKLFQRALEIIDERTGLFTQGFAALKREFTEAAGVFNPVVEAFQRFGEILLTIASKVFGFFVDRLASVFQAITAVVARNPFGVFGDNTVQTFTRINGSLQRFRGELTAVNFDIRKLGDTARQIASIDAPIPVNLEELAALRQEFANFGKTDLQLLEEELFSRLELIQRAFDQELLSQQEFETLKTQIIAQASQERFQLLNKDAIEASKQLSRTLQGGLVRVVQSAAASIGQALAQGSFSFKSFVGTVLGIIGDLLLQLSGAFIAIGLGVEAIKASIVGLSAGPALAAGLALAILGGALKAFSSSLGGQQTSGGGVGVPGGTAGDTGGGFTPGEFSLSEEEERQGPSTNVAVNIQGDVLDSEETGLRIVNVLNEAFDKQGVVVKRGVIA